MSDMKTFTVRELDREPATVLNACDREGAVKIGRRDGRSYTIRPDSWSDRILAVPDFRARLARIFQKRLTSAQARLWKVMEGYRQFGPYLKPQNPKSRTCNGLIVQ